MRKTNPFPVFLLWHIHSSFGSFFTYMETSVSNAEFPPPLSDAINCCPPGDPHMFYLRGSEILNVTDPLIASYLFWPNCIWITCVGNKAPWKVTFICLAAAFEDSYSLLMKTVLSPKENRWAAVQVCESVLGCLHTKRLTGTGSLQAHAYEFTQLFMLLELY